MNQIDGWRREVSRYRADEDIDNWLLNAQQTIWQKRPKHTTEHFWGTISMDETGLVDLTHGRGEFALFLALMVGAVGFVLLFYASPIASGLALLALLIAFLYVVCFRMWD